MTHEYRIFAFVLTKERTEQKFNYNKKQMKKINLLSFILISLLWSCQQRNSEQNSEKLQIISPGLTQVDIDIIEIPKDSNLTLDAEHFCLLNLHPIATPQDVIDFIEAPAVPCIDYEGSVKYSCNIFIGTITDIKYYKSTHTNMTSIELEKTETNLKCPDEISSILNEHHQPKSKYYIILNKSCCPDLNPS